MPEEDNKEENKDDDNINDYFISGDYPRNRDPDIQSLVPSARKLVALFLQRPIDERKKAVEKLRTIQEKYKNVSDEDIKNLIDYKNEKENPDLTKIKDTDKVNQLLQEQIKIKEENYKNELLKREKYLNKVLIEKEIIAAASNSIDPYIIYTALKDNFKVVDRDGEWVAEPINNMLDVQGNIMSVKEVVEKFLNDRPFLLRPSGISGSGIKLQTSNVNEDNNKGNTIAGMLSKKRGDYEKKLK